MFSVYVVFPFFNGLLVIWDLDIEAISGHHLAASYIYPFIHSTQVEIVDTSVSVAKEKIDVIGNTGVGTKIFALLTSQCTSQHTCLELI